MPEPSIDAARSGDPAIAATLAPLTSRCDTSHYWSGKVHQRYAMSEARLALHRTGQPVGLCPIRRGESTTRLALLDLDSHKGETPWPEMLEHAARIVGALESRGLRPVPFRSSGGSGLHLYMVWNEPQSAASVRALLKDALAACGFRNGTKGVKAGEVEVFPKQDAVPEDGWGSMFVLPYAKKSEPLDTLAFEPVPADQWTDPEMWPVSAPVPDASPPARQSEHEAAADASAPTGDLSAAREILAQLDAGAGYDEWLRVGFALHHDLGDAGFELWDSWSSGSADKYPGRDALAEKWDSFGRSSAVPVTLGSLRRQAVAPRDAFDVIEDADVFDEAEAAKHAERVAAVKVWSYADIQSRPWPEWLIRDVLPKAELSMVYGASGAGKSFVVLDMALAVARGVQWWTHEVRQGGVLWLAAEAFGSMKPRTKAYAQAHSLEDLPGFHVVEGFNLSDPERVAVLIEAVKGLQLSLCCVDTLSAASGGADENAAKEMGPVLDACRRIHHETGASVVLIHHSGKNVQLGARGWSGIRAAVQAELRVDHDEENGLRTITTTKQRDGEAGLCYAFTLHRAMVGMDDRDQPVYSASVRVGARIERTDAAKPKRAKMSTNQQAAQSVLEKHAPLPWEKAVEMIVAGLPSPDAGKRDRRKERASEALDWLCEQGLAERIDGDVVQLNEPESITDLRVEGAQDE